MERYYFVNEFFGMRVYDSKKKMELYFAHEMRANVKKLLEGDYVEIESVNYTKERQLTAPLKISMNITKKCNLRCKQCFSNSAEKLNDELTTNEIFQLFDDMKKHGTFFICIGGGEPFVREDIMDILAYGKEIGLAISIVTNGTLMTKELIEKLNQLDLDTIWISFEGLEDNHEYLRGKGTFSKALEALELLKEYNSKVAIRVSLNKNNINEVREMIKLAEIYDVDLIRFTPLMSYGRASQYDLVINQSQYISFLKEIAEIKSKVEVIFPMNIENTKFWVDPSDFGCHCGKEAIWIDERGNYSPCFFFGDDYFIGNIRNESYMELWNRSNIVTSFEGNDVCKKCANYKKCRGGCRAMVFMAYGNFDEVDPLCPLAKNNICKKQEKK